MNSFGKNFRITIFGESHSPLIGITVDGCPAGISISEQDFYEDLKRRKPLQFGTTERKEDDFPQIISGVFNGKTTGAAITVLFENKNVKSEDYSAEIIRPSHSDFVAKQKYFGFNDFRGGGIFSGRMTVGIVAAGVIAKKIIPEIKFESSIISIGGIYSHLAHRHCGLDPQSPDSCDESFYGNIKRLRVKPTMTDTVSDDILQLLEEVSKDGDSLGGVIECTVKNVPVGFGEPFFDSLESMISHLIFSIPGIKGIEFGAGFSISEMRGSEANDCFLNEFGKTKTNNSGGINAGISNGNDIVFRVAIRPTVSINKEQETYNFSTKQIEKLKINGRNDICFALRTPVIIEAATAVVLADCCLIK